MTALNMTFEALNVTSPTKRDHLLPLECTKMIRKGTSVGSFSKVLLFLLCAVRLFHALVYSFTLKFVLFIILLLL